MENGRIKNFDVSLTDVHCASTEITSRTVSFVSKRYMRGIIGLKK